MLRAILLKYLVPFWAQRLLAQVLGLALALGSGAALAAVAQTPLFLAQPPKPNVMFTLDNSGSMEWGSVTGDDALGEYTSDKYNGSGNGTDGKKNRRAYYSSTWNQIYYNPAITYSPGTDYLSASMGNSAPASARIDPYPTSGGSASTIDLRTTCYVQNTTPVAVTLPLYSATDFSASKDYATCYDTVSTSGSGSSKKTYDKAVARYAFYYTWKGSGAPSGSSGQDTDANYTRVDILSTTSYPIKASTRTDCVSSSCTYAEELRNFANWFTYYRTRILMTKTSIGLAFAPIDPVVSPVNPSKFRVGFNTINKPGSTASNTSVADDAGWLTIRDFDKDQKQKFYVALYAINPNGGTPLRDQMDRIGQLYKGTLSKFDYTGNDPYRASATDASLVSCRPSYQIMSTDGFWNGASGDSPFTASSSLADIADYYYKTDLRTGLANNVKPTSTRDTATTQHMTTFTIGLGADGTIPYSTTQPTTWPTAKADDPTAIDDLWHAAVMGKGRYFSAKNPVELQTGLIGVLKDIAIQGGAAASGAISGSAINGNSLFYAPGFESGKWIGHLKAYSLDTTAAVGDVQWDAATQLPAWGARNIVTWNPVTKAAVNFSWTNLTTGSGSQQAALTSSDVLDYLRGNGAKEQTKDGNGPGIYRYRENKLGDIVDSSPLYVKKSDSGYGVLPTDKGGRAIYNTFLSGKDNRTAMLYAGANDGMLHGFNATTGVETFAFVPNAVYPNLVSLSNPDYGHQYYVDGLLTQGDAYLGSVWKTILLGSIGAGGSSIFAIDITDPTALTASKVMWEIMGGGTDDFADMGRVMGQLTMVRLRNGDWGAIFGNGYDSKNGKAALYVVNVSTGTLIKKFDVAPSVTANGMAAPALLFNSDRELIAAYAGDLKGNLWKFDFAGTSASSWSSRKLFTAINGDNKVQPMVKRPAIAPHPTRGYMVTVATGKFMEEGDTGNVDVQSIYGIWDDPDSTAVTGRTQLVQQSFTVATGGRTLSTKTVDWNTKRGWYIDLSLTTGERVIGDLDIFDNAVVVATTLAPVSDICLGGGVSQQMAIGYLNGGANAKALFSRGTTELTGLSSIAIYGTVANPAWVATGRGKRVAVFSPSDGGVPGNGGGDGGANADKPLELSTGAAPMRTWHQLIIKN